MTDDPTEQYLRALALAMDLGYGLAHGDRRLPHPNDSTLVAKGPESDVRIDRADEGLYTCIGCTLSGGYRRWVTAGEITGHLQAHIALGEMVPADLLGRIRQIGSAE